MDAFPAFGPVTDASGARLSWVLTGLAQTWTQTTSTATHGGRYYATSARHCAGCRFLAPSGVAWKIALWDASGTLVTSKTITTTVSGLHVIAWSSPVSVNASVRFTVSIHDTAGSGQQTAYYATSGTTPALPTSNVPQPLGPYLYSEEAGLFSAGDAYPTTSLGGTYVVAIEPLLDVDALVTTD